MQQVQPGSPSKKSRARRLKKYKNTTYNNIIIIILLEVAGASEASLGRPSRLFPFRCGAGRAAPGAVFKKEGVSRLHLLHLLRLEKL